LYIIHTQLITQKTKHTIQLMTIIIGLHGHIGSGKDTIADYLVSHYNFRKISFAEPLKRIVSIITGWSFEYLNGQTEEYRVLRETVVHPIFKKTGRQLLQEIGTDVFRNHFDENIWINIMENSLQTIISQSQSPPQNIVVTDCRFENEVEVLKKFKNNYFIMVHRPPFDEPNRHVSEKKLNIKDAFHVINNGTLDELYSKIDYFISFIDSNDSNDSK